MTQKIKKQVYIDSEQDERLKRLSELLGISEDELMQRAICSYIDGEQGNGQREVKRSPDRRAWLKELEFMEKPKMYEGLDERGSHEVYLIGSRERKCTTEL